MTNYEIWSLILNAFIAIGTVGAVVVALGNILINRVRYKISDIRVSKRINRDKTNDQFLHILFDNRSPARMEIFRVEITAFCMENTSSSSQGWTFKDEYIPEHSQYEIEIPIQTNWAPGAFKNKETKIIVKTSLGDKVKEFPHKWKPLLTQCLEFPEKETN
ncbi:hypothetical protein [Terasakiella sp.]|uniref:hypothetical protein n=1 Tax=Terasakiella sp. TaxID=2034861 RepID=UPI003AA98458